MSALKPALPWYRHPEPWLLLMAPLAAVVAGLVTGWLAINANNSLVADDYYREGRAINQTFERERRAVQLGLSAHWEMDLLQGRARIALVAASGPFDRPERLVVRLIHATEASLDHRVVLTRTETAGWEAPFAAPMKGRWTIQIEDEGRTWRLTANLTDPAAALDVLPAHRVGLGREVVE